MTMYTVQRRGPVQYGYALENDLQQNWYVMAGRKVTFCHGDKRLAQRMFNGECKKRERTACAKR